MSDANPITVLEEQDRDPLLAPFDPDDDGPFGGQLPGVDRSDILDLIIGFIILLLTGTLLLSVAADWPKWTIYLNVTLLGITSFMVAYRRMLARPDRVRAQQSDHLLTIAREAVAHFRSGLNPETARAVCAIILRESPDTVAVAITDTTDVLAFVGQGESHHHAGRPISTQGTRDALEKNRPEVLTTKEAIGCPRKYCPLEAAIVVPLTLDDRAVGTLKFYYKDDKYLNENELAMAQGIADLLSTQLEINELEQQAALATKMELKALQAQISPHFLFNTLNTIGSYIRTDPAFARRLLGQFAAFYRYTLEHGDEPATLARELDFVRQYFALEQARFGDRLSFVEAVEPGLDSLALPAFMLQPLVENSVGHGMRPDGSVLTITVGARREGGRFFITVADDGVGISTERLASIYEHDPSSGGLGIALNNVRDRLRGIYGPEAEFTIESALNEGTTVSMIINPETAESPEF